MAQMAGGSSPFVEVTVAEATTTIADSYDAIEALIDSTNHARWFAFVDDSAYLTSGGDKVWAIFGTTSNNQRAIYRNASNYDYAYRFNYGSSTGKIPAGTVFKVLYLP